MAWSLINGEICSGREMSNSTTEMSNKKGDECGRKIVQPRSRSYKEMYIFVIFILFSARASKKIP